MKKVKFKFSEANEDTLASIMAGIMIAAMIIGHILYND